MIGAIGAVSWGQLASLRPSSATAAGGAVPAIRNNVVYEIAPIAPIRGQSPSFRGYGASGQAAVSDQPGRTVDRCV